MHCTTSSALHCFNASTAMHCIHLTILHYTTTSALYCITTTLHCSLVSSRGSRGKAKLRLSSHFVLPWNIWLFFDVVFSFKIILVLPWNILFFFDIVFFFQKQLVLPGNILVLNEKLSMHWCHDPRSFFGFSAFKLTHVTPSPNTLRINCEIIECKHVY